MHRARGVILLLIGSMFLMAGAVFVFAAWAQHGRGSILPLILAVAALAAANAALRNAFRTLALGRVVFASSVVVTIIAVAAILYFADVSGRQHRRQVITMAEMRKIAVALEAGAEGGKPYPRTAVFPQRDGWGHPFRYEWQAPDGYAIASAGRDGLWQKSHLRDYKEAATTNFDDDIVFANGSFVQYPDSGPHPY